MQISLTPELERAVMAKVESGLYRDESDVIRDALRRLLAQEGTPWTIEALRREVAVGAAEADRGEFVHQTMDEIFAEWEKDNSSKN